MSTINTLRSQLAYLRGEVVSMLPINGCIDLVRFTLDDSEAEQYEVLCYFGDNRISAYGKTPAEVIKSIKEDLEGLKDE